MYHIRLVDLRIQIVRPDGSVVFELPMSGESMTEAEAILENLNRVAA